MSTVRSNKLAVGTSAATGENVICTAPAGHRYLVKFVSVYNNAGGPVTMTLGVKSGGVDYWVAPTTAVASAGIYSTSAEITLDVGDSLVVYKGSASSVTWYAGGVDFTL